MPLENSLSNTATAAIAAPTYGMAAPAALMNEPLEANVLALVIALPKPAIKPCSEIVAMVPCNPRANALLAVAALSPASKPVTLDAAAFNPTAPSPAPTTPWITGRNTIVLNILTTTSRKFSAKPLPLSKPRNRASVMESLIFSAAFFQSSAAVLAALVLKSATCPDAVRERCSFSNLMRSCISKISAALAS